MTNYAKQEDRRPEARIDVHVQGRRSDAGGSAAR